MGKRKRATESDSPYPKPQMRSSTTNGAGSSETAKYSCQKFLALQIIAGTYERVLHGITATISFDPDAITTNGGTVEFADSFLFNAHASSIRCLALSAPSRQNKITLASGGSDQTINLYHLSARRELAKCKEAHVMPGLIGRKVVENPRNRELGSLQHHAASVNALQFPTRSKLLSAADDNTIAVARTRDWTILSTIKPPIPKAYGRPSGDTAPLGGIPLGVNDFAVHPSMKLMISLTKGEKCMRLWNLVTGKRAGVLNFDKSLLQAAGDGRWGRGEGYRVEWDPLGEEFVIAFERGAVVFGLDSRPKGVISPDPPSKIHQVHYIDTTTESQLLTNALAVSTEDGRVILYSTRHTREKEPTDPRRSLGLPALLAVGQIGGAKEGSASRIKDFECLPIPSDTEPSSSKLIVTGSSDGVIRIWTLDLSSGIIQSPKLSVQDSDGINSKHQESDPSGTIRQLGKAIGKYDTGNRITCLKAFVMSDADDDETDFSNVTAKANVHGNSKTIDANMATNGDLPSEDESLPDDQASDGADGHEVDDVEEEEDFAQKPKSALKKSSRLDPLPEVKRPELPEQPNPEDLDVSTLTPLSPEIIARQATINIGTIGHVAHGKSTVVKAISGVQTVRFKNELERNITIKLGYANAKVYRCDNEACPRPGCYRSYKSEKEVDPPCEREGCQGRYRLLRHVSFVDCPGHDILMSTMLSGAAVMDAALLLIAGNETCPQPQTSEHLAAIEIMKLNHIIILQNKVDLMREEGAESHYQSILNFIRGTVADGSPIIPISAQLKYNIDAINEYLVTKIPVPPRDFGAAPHMIIIRSFDVNKPGAEIEDLKGGVAGGSILNGVLKLGDEIEIRPGLVTKDDEGKIKCRPIFSRVVSLFAEHNDLKFAVPGGLIGVGTRVDPTLCRADRLVGFVLGLKGRLPAIFTELEVNFFLLRRLLGVKTADGKQAKVAKLAKNEVLMVNIGSTATGAKVMAVKADLAKLSLTSPACTELHEKIALSRRIDKHWRLIGWANIVK
ncbi:MAG: hypothetical protein Q9174_000015 [Haloplaca sp. 1 TL-2023]